MSDQKFRTFPEGKVSALTMLYLQNLDISNLTPEELADKYNEIYLKIDSKFNSRFGTTNEPEANPQHKRLF